MVAPLLACGGPEPESAPASIVSTGEERAAPTFVFAPVGVLDADNDGIEIAADGAMSVSGRPFGRWSTDGDFVDDEGTLRLQVTAEGVLRTADGVMLAQLDGDALRVGEHTLSVGADGIVQGVPEDAPPLRLVPADSPARRVALASLGMWLFIVAAGPASIHVESGPGEAVDPPE
ncbi:MAG: hypothetical protein KF901_10255 [Myxococcales bacterium]|nr:hypothetical protein [Myxococcales bacterium]